MQTLQAEFKSATDPIARLAPLAALRPNLILVFGAPAYFEDYRFGQSLADEFPGAAVIGCSTAGEISSTGVHGNSCIVTAVRFDHVSIATATADLANMDDSANAGTRLAQQLKDQSPRAVMVFGQGVNINGSALIEGMAAVLGPGVPITGGLAGDNGAFARTWTMGPRGVSDRAVVAIGLRGDRLGFSHGFFGGWQPFGPARQVTRCDGNVLQELDGEPALAVYKRYLGDYAKDLPSSGLLFPFAMLAENRNEIGLIRTILGVNEADGSLVLAGAIERGGYLKLMHASTEALVDGAETAARIAHTVRDLGKAGLAILVSCVGRKLVMGDRTEEEVEAVAAVLGQETTLAGFYSYGEISPLAPGIDCKLHNQTMTITCLTETGTDA
jgi:hypothetical protein